MQHAAVTVATPSARNICGPREPGTQTPTATPTDHAVHALAARGGAGPNAVDELGFGGRALKGIAKKLKLDSQPCFD